MHISHQLRLLSPRSSTTHSPAEGYSEAAVAALIWPDDKHVLLARQNLIEALTRWISFSNISWLQYTRMSIGIIALLQEAAAVWLVVTVQWK